MNIRIGLSLALCSGAVLLASASLHAEAVTRDVSTAAELVAALEELNAKDAGNVIRLAPGGYDVSPYAMRYFNRSYVEQTTPTSHIAAAKLKLVGTGATARDVVLYGDRSNRILVITGGGLENLTVSNGYTKATSGGGVQCTSSSGVVSSNVVVTCCTSSSSGGGAYNGTWYDSLFCSNSVYTSHGGGICCGTYYNCVVSNNYAKKSGGGGYYGLDLHDCTVVCNRSGESGGGVAGSNAAAGLCHVYGGLIAGNAGSSGGGASWSVFHGGTVVSNNTSTSNGTSAGGGGIYIGDSTRADFVVDTVVCCNTAANMGGGIYVANTNAVVSNCLVRANTAETGGGIRGVGVVRDCVLAGNRASSGGGLYAGPGGVFFGLTITNNTCAKNGGGAYVGSGGAVTNCLVCGNESETTGGGAYVIGLFADSVVSNNLSQKSSGGVYGTNSGSVFGLVSNCLIACNGARTVGGGAYMDGGAALYASVVSNNWCDGVVDSDDVTVGGGGVRLYDGGRVHDSKVVQNWIRSNSKKSSCYGGGVYSSSSCLVSNCLVAGNATYSGGKNVQGGGTYSGKLVDCVIRDNFLFGTLGMAMNTGSALRCVISNNASSASSPYSVRQVSSLTDCTICGAMTGAYVLDRCRVVNFTNWVYLAEGANAATSGWFNVGASLLNAYTAATNTLFADNYLGTTALFYGSGTNSVGLSLRFHNCTVADNVSGNVVRGSNTNFFENCIFARNRSSNGDLKSLTVENPEVNAATNCVFWPACTAALGGRSACLDANPRFVDDGSEDAHQIKYASPARGRGLVRDWMEGANDLRGEGYPRKRDGLVDIGCYQCWLDPVGTLLLLR